MFHPDNITVSPTSRLSKLQDFCFTNVPHVIRTCCSPTRLTSDVTLVVVVIVEVVGADEVGSNVGDELGSGDGYGLGFSVVGAGLGLGLGPCVVGAGVGDGLGTVVAVAVVEVSSVQLARWMVNPIIASCWVSSTYASSPVSPSMPANRTRLSPSIRV